GGVVEEVPDLDPCAGGAVPGADRGQVAAVAGDLAAARPAAGARLERHLRDAANRRQRLAAEAERADAEQVVGVAQLPGSVPGEGERQIFRDDAAAVVHDADQLCAALLDLDVDPVAAGVHAVFQEFLDDAGGALDDLAGGDLGDDGGG